MESQQDALRQNFYKQQRCTDLPGDALDRGTFFPGIERGRHKHQGHHQENIEQIFRIKDKLQDVPNGQQLDDGSDSRNNRILFEAKFKRPGQDQRNKDKNQRD